LSGLGGVYNMQRDQRALDTIQRSLTLCERLREFDTNCMAPPLVNLGVAAKDRGDFAAAEAYYRRALAIRQPIVGADSPDLIPNLNNLANLYNSMGDHARALDAHFQALRIEEHGLSPYHRYALLTAGNLAVINTATGNLAAAIAFQQRADAIVEKQLALNMAVGSERQKLAFVRGVVDRTDRTISLHLREAPGSADAEALAALVVLQRKGRVLDAMTDIFAAARKRDTDPHDRELLERLNDTTARLAALASSAPEGTTPEARQASIVALDELKERLEAEIGSRDAEFRSQTQPVTLQAVQAAMPEDAALLEFVVFRPFDAREDRYEDAYQPPHYAAYVVRKNAAPRGFDLGPSRAIDQAIAGLRESLRDPARALRVLPKAIPQMAPWLLAFARNCTASRYESGRSRPFERTSFGLPPVRDVLPSRRGVGAGQRSPCRVRRVRGLGPNTAVSSRLTRPGTSAYGPALAVTCARIDSWIADVWRASSACNRCSLCRSCCLTCASRAPPQISSSTLVASGATAF
jgi:tetratricopeptide (TPR) repeat protein